MSNLLTFNLVVSDAIEAMNCYKDVFEGVTGDVYEFPDQEAANEANIQVGSVNLRLIDENPMFDCYPPKAGEIDSIWLQIVVDDVEAVLEKAKKYSVTVNQEINEFMGTKNCGIIDPYGYTWTINQILHEISFEERYAIYHESYENMKKNEIEEKE